MQSFLEIKNNTTEFANWNRPGYRWEHFGTHRVNLGGKRTFDITTGVYILTP